MKATNRTTKTLSKFVASKDELRPGLQGVLTGRQEALASDGHKLFYVKLDGEYSDYETGSFLIDEKQAMNADFHPALHERLEEKLPDFSSVIPEYEDVREPVRFRIEVLHDTLTALKKLGLKDIDIYPSKTDYGEYTCAKATAFVAHGSRNGKGNVKEVMGLIMPVQMDEERSYFTKADREAISTFTAKCDVNADVAEPPTVPAE